jgi:alpha-amylase/alpha-mannosidase (GH57 family)
MSDVRARPVRLVLLWHMHQPDFRDSATGEFRLPWVYLHALKDYSDMAAHLERHRGVRAVVNFVPVLVDQLEDYVDQFRFGRLRDPLLELLGRGDLEAATPVERALILDRCFRANHEKMVDPFPAYVRLHELFRLSDEAGGEAGAYLSGQYFSDLITWYHLAWCGETVRRQHPRVGRLMAKGSGFTSADRRDLLEVVGSVVAEILPRWRALADAGQVELSTTPFYHPIGPLLLDFAVARERQPDLSLPRESCYPGGKERTRQHIDWALAFHEQRFGRRAAGMWPAEGALSAEFARLIGAAGMRWTASGQSVLAASIDSDGMVDVALDGRLYRGHRLGAAGPVAFFRDDRLSDRIGFEYARWHGREAAADFVAELERIGAEAPADEVPLVSVILDGENAWEYYPYNGYHFLNDLYGLLDSHPTIRTTTYAEVLAAEDGGRFPVLDRLVAGSWVYGDLSTWIGHREKNRAWELLCEAKQHYDRILGEGRLSAAQREQASRQLGVCEGSDWCWWFGDHNPPESVRAIDVVYRANLSHLYELLGEPVPAELSVPVSQGGAGDAGTRGAMHRAG